MNKAALVPIAATAVLALVAFTARASAVTVIDLQAVLDGEGAFEVPVTVPCGGERVDLRGSLAVRLLLRDDGSIGYSLDAEDVVGTGAVTATTYHLVGAAGGETRPGETFAADLMLVGEARAPVPIEVRLRTTLDRSGGLAASVGSLRPVRFCDPGTLTLSDGLLLPSGLFDLKMAGTALEPGSTVALYGVMGSRGSAVATEELASWPTSSDGTFGGILVPMWCLTLKFLYATGTSASGQPVISNTYFPPC